MLIRGRHTRWVRRGVLAVLLVAAGIGALAFAATGRDDDTRAVAAAAPKQEEKTSDLPPLPDMRPKVVEPVAGNAGITALANWLGHNTRGVFWGSYRCEKWGKGSASLHAENRAIDWHLDALHRADRRAADKLFRLLLAPDNLGNPQALARRMGVEELIWDCGYWGSGMTEFRPYSVCYKPNGKKRKRFDRTSAHQDHIHIGMTKRGAKGLTSFWTAD